MGKLLRLARRKKNPDLSRRELLDGLRSLSKGIEMKHSHVVRREREPMPVRGTMTLVREDGSRSFRYIVNVGPEAFTSVTVPWYAVMDNAPAGHGFQVEFVWER